jgi:hypothetical protein
MHNVAGCQYSAEEINFMRSSNEATSILMQSPVGEPCTCTNHCMKMMFTTPLLINTRGTGWPR